jgi:hypothetical protein
MLETLYEKVESLFEVRQTSYTGKRIFLTFILIVLAAASLPLYFRYEEKIHEDYALAYGEAKNWISTYRASHGEYPLGQLVSLEDEKDLKKFFEENRLNVERRLYYANVEKLPELNQHKYTYIIDVDHGTLFTAEYVIYNMRRMHVPGY